MREQDTVMIESQRHQDTLRYHANRLGPSDFASALTYALRAMEREDDYRAACEAALVWILSHYVEGDEQRAQARELLRVALAREGSVLLSVKDDAMTSGQCLRAIIDRWRRTADAWETHVDEGRLAPRKRDPVAKLTAFLAQPSEDEHTVLARPVTTEFVDRPDSDSPALVWGDEERWQNMHSPSAPFVQEEPQGGGCEMPDDEQSLIARIARWREGDRARQSSTKSIFDNGYSVAIALLCEAEQRLTTLTAQDAAIVSELEDLQVSYQREIRARIEAQQRLAILEAERYVPGDWHCPTCGFELHKRVLRASDGAVGIDARDASDICPNDGSSMVPVTWQHAAEGSERMAIQQMERAIAAEARIQQLEADLNHARERQAHWETAAYVLRKRERTAFEAGVSAGRDYAIAIEQDCGERPVIEPMFADYQRQQQELSQQEGT